MSIGDTSPYTDEQHEVFRKAAGRHVDLDREDCRLILEGIHDAGITVTFPEPRYLVRVGFAEAVVWERVGRSQRSIAHFDVQNHPDARCAAQAEADRLNREVAS